MTGVDLIVALLNSPLTQAAANASQFTDLALNIGQTSNDEIMAELQAQDTRYFEDIVARLERIERRLDHENH